MRVSLSTALEHRTWRELRATAHAHGLRFNTNLDKKAACARLHHELVAGQLRRSFRSLSLQDRAALAALQAADGTLYLHEFTAAFGEIRAYKPWHDDAAVHPWRRPVSPAEKLWFLGFAIIHKGERGRPRTVRVPAEVLDLLPPLPRPRPHARRVIRTSLTPDTLRIDLAALLGSLLVTPVKPRWKRWLPPSALKTINARLRSRENLDAVRSELQTGRLRFLHYLADVGGLLSPQNGAILPTPAAWSWLDLSPGEQWRWLWAALDRDLNGRNRIWEAYRFPPVSPHVWTALMTVLRDLHPGGTYTIPALVESLRPYTREDETIASVPDLLRGPLAWAGITATRGEQFTLAAPAHAALHGDPYAFVPAQNATIWAEGDALWLDISAVPRTRPWAEFAAWGTLTHGRWSVDAESVARAVEQGHTAHDVVRVLADLCGRPLPRAAFEQIQTWVKQADQLVLRQMTVLTSPHAELLAGLRQDRRLREMFAEPLSAHHSAVRPHAADALRQHLARRGYRVTAQLSPAQTPHSGDLSPEMAEYLWLAARVYHDLSTFVALPVRIPAAVLHDLAARLPVGCTDAQEHSAGLIHERLARTIDGFPALPPPVAQHDPIAIRRAIEAAYEAQGAITIEYFSPGYGAETIRTIKPILPITASEGVEYIEAWCDTAAAARTFRVDRILRIVDAPSDTVAVPGAPERPAGLCEAETPVGSDVMRELVHQP
ncbi:WYL domain-containing protein [Aggregatilinea lenta]|uniref:WYL domain-containing protein n=1 Tax=Aggregatilinea lenta TaxID=913108 RepID=UPI0013C32718|nr:WYL domain-containing protein [Aggregatilinea lenta]